MEANQILNDISHRRYNALRGSWVLVSPHRTKRPWQGQQEAPSTNTLPEHDEACYLCPGNPRAAGDSNPKYDSTFVFTNDFSAVKEDQPDYKPEADEANDKAKLLLRAEGVRGKCFVICFNPKHNLTLADLTPTDLIPIIKTWTDLYRSLMPPSCPWTYIQIFENKGAAMGCSNPHPHGQAWATQSLPEEPSLEIASMRKYRHAHNNACLLCDYVELEMSKTSERIIFSNQHFVALCPWWAVWPFEVLVLPKRHMKSLLDLNTENGEIEAFAEVLNFVTIRYDNLFETSFPYSMGLHQSPLQGVDQEDAEGCHLHVHFYPPLLRSATVRKFLVGYELLGEPQRDITPEQAAARLRALSGELYRKKLSG